MYTIFIQFDYHSYGATLTLHGHIINQNRKIIFILEKNDFLKFDF